VVASQEGSAYCWGFRETKESEPFDSVLSQPKGSMTALLAAIFSDNFGLLLDTCGESKL
jgi:hypothetical protein